MKKLLLAPIGFLLFLNVNGMDEVAHDPYAKAGEVATQQQELRWTEENKHITVSTPTLSDGRPITINHIFMRKADPASVHNLVPTARIEMDIRCAVYKMHFSTIGGIFGRRSEKMLKESSSRVFHVIPGEKIMTRANFGEGWKFLGVNYAQTPAELGIN